MFDYDVALRANVKLAELAKIAAGGAAASGAGAAAADKPKPQTAPAKQAPLQQMPTPPAGLTPSKADMAAFQKNHASSYDPNSRMDRGKMQAYLQSRQQKAPAAPAASPKAQGAHSGASAGVGGAQPQAPNAGALASMAGAAAGGAVPGRSALGTVGSVGGRAAPNGVGGAVSGGAASPGRSVGPSSPSSILGGAGGARGVQAPPSVQAGGNAGGTRGASGTASGAPSFTPGFLGSNRSTNPIDYAAAPGGGAAKPAVQPKSSPSVSPDAVGGKGQGIMAKAQAARNNTGPDAAESKLQSNLAGKASDKSNSMMGKATQMAKDVGTAFDHHGGQPVFEQGPAQKSQGIMAKGRAALSVQPQAFSPGFTGPKGPMPNYNFPIPTGLA